MKKCSGMGIGNGDVPVRKECIKESFENLVYKESKEPVLDVEINDEKVLRKLYSGKPYIVPERLCKYNI